MNAALERLVCAHCTALFRAWIYIWRAAAGEQGRPAAPVDLATAACAHRVSALWILVNAGIWLVVLTAWLNWPAWVLPGGRLLEAAAVIAFAVHAWPRIKPWMETTD